MMNWIPLQGSLIKNTPDGQSFKNIKNSITSEDTADIIVDAEMVSNSEEETYYIGQRIAGLLSSGSTVALEGTLGSGKTCLTKGIASGLGISEIITSPTYTIISEYPLPIRLGKKKPSGSPALYHIDVYRLNNEEDFDQIGGSEIINSGGIAVIEWSERIQKSLPENTITVTIEISGPSSRLIKIKDHRPI